MKKRVLIVSIVVAMMISLTGCESWNRFKKSFGSDMSDGLDRTVTVYDYNGQEIKSWSGKFDVSESENEVYFDKDGKRVIIHGGIVINEEN